MKMKSTIYLPVMLLIALAFQTAACDDARKEGKLVSSSVPKAAAVRDTFWIDVRTPAEFADGHLSEAYNIPLQEFASRFPLELTNKNAVVALYCRSGNRSGQALRMAQEMGYTKAFNAGGFAALSAARKH